MKFALSESLMVFFSITRICSWALQGHWSAETWSDKYICPHKWVYKWCINIICHHHMVSALIIWNIWPAVSICRQSWLASVVVITILTEAHISHANHCLIVASGKVALTLHIVVLPHRTPGQDYRFKGLILWPYFRCSNRQASCFCIGIYNCGSEGDRVIESFNGLLIVSQISVFYDCLVYIDGTRTDFGLKTHYSLWHSG